MGIEHQSWPVIRKGMGIELNPDLLRKGMGIEHNPGPF